MYIEATGLPCYWSLTSHITITDLYYMYTDWLEGLVCTLEPLGSHVTGLLHHITITDLYYTNWLEGLVCTLKPLGSHVTGLLHHTLQSLISITCILTG